MSGTKKGEWGFVSPQATLYLQTNFGLQSWNSVRALDFLVELDDADSNRLGVTGASGGGTQTMIIAAIDDRIDAAFPCVMPSTAMQGGCTCENTHYLRIGQGNMDLAAALAPKPLGMTAADDWTIELETKGYPDLVALYKMLGAPGNYEAHFDIHFKHNYNHVSRTHMYSFVNRHFKLGLEEPVLERDFTHLGRKELAIWTEGGAGEPQPEGYLSGDTHEKALNQVWAADSDRQLAGAMKTPTDSWIRTGWETILRADDVRETKATFELGEKEVEGGMVWMTGSIAGNSSPFPASIVYPKNWNGEVVICLNGGEPQGNATVIDPDLYGRNDDQACNAPTTYSGKKEIEATSWQHSPVYFYGYNDSVFVRRVHDLVSTIAMVRQHPDWDTKKLIVEADGSLAAVALAASLIVGDQIDELKTNPGDFSFSAIDSNWDDNMVPGALKYGGVKGLQALVAK
jgi:dienelactone hydrolase